MVYMIVAMNAQNGIDRVWLFKENSQIPYVIVFVIFLYMVNFVLIKLPHNINLGFTFFAIIYFFSLACCILLLSTRLNYLCKCLRITSLFLMQLNFMLPFFSSGIY
jgi:hypothetical protein